MQRLLPKRADFRMRAHINPFNTPFFPYPPHHSYVDWKKHFPLHFGGDINDKNICCNTEAHPLSYSQQQQRFSKNIDFLDVGCGYGGLLFGLAPYFP